MAHGADCWNPNPPPPIHAGRSHKHSGYQGLRRQKRRFPATLLVPRPQGYTASAPPHKLVPAKGNPFIYHTEWCWQATQPPPTVTELLPSKNQCAHIP